MKLMLYEMSLFMQRDVEEALSKLGIEFRVFMYPFVPPITENDEYFEKAFCDALRSGDYDGVFSLNFWSPISKCCHKLGIPYISWVYDCPFGLTQSEESMRIPTNHIFIFDRMTCEKLWQRGINTVVHQPLAVNLDRLDGISTSARDREKYEVDVSFVGTLYPSTFSGFMKQLGNYDKGFVEGVIEAQSRVYGAYFLDQVLCGESSERIRKSLNGDEELFEESLQSIVAKEITRRDRLTMLAALSEQYKVALYSNREEPFLKKVKYRGTADSYEEIYKVYKLSRINLNITFRRIVTGIPLRAMDIMGAGGFLLTNYQEEICEHFKPGADCAVYESIEDALMQAVYYLEHEDERREIASNGRKAMEKFALVKVLKDMIETVFGKV